MRKNKYPDIHDLTLLANLLDLDKKKAWTATDLKNIVNIALPRP